MFGRDFSSLHDLALLSGDLKSLCSGEHTGRKEDEDAEAAHGLSECPAEKCLGCTLLISSPSWQAMPTFPRMPEVLEFTHVYSGLSK